MSDVLADDIQFQEVSLRKVDHHPGKGWTVERDDGWSMWLEEYGHDPKVGDVARFYGDGIGRPVRGVLIAGHIVYYRTPAEEAERQAETSREYDERRRKMRAETKIPETVTSGFEWTEDMAEISGFGGGYERACRQMISQGCLWWADNPDADPRYHGFKGVYGICSEDNDDAKAMSAAINAGCDGSGAMHQAAVAHVFHWRKLGSWLAYQNSMVDLARQRATEGDDE